MNILFVQVQNSSSIITIWQERIIITQEYLSKMTLSIIWKNHSKEGKKNPKEVFPFESKQTSKTTKCDMIQETLND